MSRRYAVTGTDTNTAGTTMLGVTSATTIRPAMSYLAIGSVATPADNAWEYFIQRYTAAGTSTSVTPQALDPGDPAALASAGQAHSAEPTYTANAVLLRVAGSQRTPFVWYAQPGWQFKMPATAANGLGVYSNAIGGSAVAMSFTIHYEE